MGTRPLEIPHQHTTGGEEGPGGGRRRQTIAYFHVPDVDAIVAPAGWLQVGFRTGLQLQCTSRLLFNTIIGDSLLQL